MGEVVLVLQPWHAPIPLTRVWCIFEAYAAEATHSRFSIAMTEAEASDLVRTICHDPSTLLAALRRVCCEASTATQAEDRNRIFDTVRQSVGFAQLDSMVASRMIEAVCTEMSRQTDDALQATGGIGRMAEGLQALAQLRWLQRNYAEAERLHRKCLATADATGLAPDFFIRASIGIAAACARQGKGEEARKLYTSVLQDISMHDPIRMEVVSGLALECYAFEELHIEADRLAEDWETRCALEKCGMALRNFGMMRLAQGRTTDAERLLRAGVDALRELAREWSPLLPWHPDTLEAMAGVAAAVAAEKRLAEAEDGLRGLLARSERFLGAEHKDTLAIRTSLVALVKRSTAECARTESGPEPRRQAKGGSSPGLSKLGQAKMAGELYSSGGGRAVEGLEASTTTGGVLEGLWQDLPGLAVLRANLRLREVQGLDRGMCCLFLVKSLDTSCATVDLSDNGLDSASATALATALPAVTSLTSLDLRGQDLGGGVWPVMAALLPRAARLQVGLNGDVIVVSGAGAKGKSYMTLSGGKGLGPDGAQRLAELLQNAPPPLLAELDLRGCRLGVAGWGAVADALERVTSLSSLNGCGQYAAIRAGGLAELNLRGTELGVWAALFLERSAATLTMLDMSQNRIGAGGATAIGPSLTALCALQTLDLSRNWISDAGFAAIVPALARFTALQQLNLPENRLKADGGTALASALTTLTNLQAIDISGNTLGTEGGTALASALTTLGKLQSINMSRNEMEDPCLAPLVLALARLTRLGESAGISAAFQQLDLRGNRISYAALAQARDARIKIR